MTLKLNTEMFKLMVSKSAAGASQDKLLPITSMVCIEVSNGRLVLTTTDTSNTLQIIQSNVESDDFYAVVPIDIFSKLVAKTTADTISLSVDEKGTALTVVGNGKYTIALCSDEEGVVRFPTYKFKKAKEPETVKLTTVKSILAVNKPSVCKTIDSPHLWAYYAGAMVISTDEQTICYNRIQLSKSEILVSAEMMDLLGLFMQEDILFHQDKGYFLFESANAVLHGPEHSGKEKFPLPTLNNFLGTSFPYVCKIPKSTIQAVMDRLALFIEPYDKNGAYFTFTKDGIRVTSKRMSSAEVIAYAENTSASAFKCCVDIPLLQQQINAIQTEAIDLWYGSPSSIKMVSGKDGQVTQIVALLQDENLEENGGN